MRILAITRIYPNRVTPTAAPFNRQQVEALSKHADVEVMGVIPWFPGARALSRWSKAGRLHSVPREETIGGVRVRHPRILYLPQFHATAPALFAASLLPRVLPYRGKVDALYVPWAFPDGCASVILARALGVPTIVNVLGSDINISGNRPSSNWILRQALPQCDRVVAVSQPLADEVVKLGVPSDRVNVVHNGVDGELFRPMDREVARVELGLEKNAKFILYLGRLEAEKGIFDLLDAYVMVEKENPDARLLFVGEGRDRMKLEERTDNMGELVEVIGPQQLKRVPSFMASADMVALPSWSEGEPNVLLEALRCGRRVIGSSVGGIPALISNSTRGIIVPPHDPTALAKGLLKGIAEDYDPEEVAQDAGDRSWDDSARELLEIIEGAVRG